MKKQSDRNTSVLAEVDAKGKRQSRFVTLGVMLFFVLSAFTFMNFLYCLSDCIGSIVCASVDVALRDALRSLPIFLSFFMTLSGLMVFHTFYRNENEKILRRKAKKHAILGIALGLIIIVYVIVGLVIGKYLSIVEGAPSKLYPLDSILYALFFIALGIAVLLYFKKAQPYCGPSRAPLQKHGRGLRSFFRTFWLLIGLYGFCGFFYSLFIVDFKNGYLPYSIAVMCVSLVAFLSIAVWELYYNNLTADRKKEVTLPLALLSFGFAAAAAGFYFFALRGNLDGPANVGFGILPIAFSASVNFATLLVVALPLIVSITALVRGIYRKAKLKN